MIERAGNTVQHGRGSIGNRGSSKTDEYVLQQCVSISIIMSKTAEMRSIPTAVRMSVSQASNLQATATQLREKTRTKAQQAFESAKNNANATAGCVLHRSSGGDTPLGLWYYKSDCVLRTRATYRCTALGP